MAVVSLPPPRPHSPRNLLPRPLFSSTSNISEHHHAPWPRPLVVSRSTPSSPGRIQTASSCATPIVAFLWQDSVDEEVTRRRERCQRDQAPYGSTRVPVLDNQGRYEYSSRMCLHCCVFRCFRPLPPAGTSRTKGGRGETVPVGDPSVGGCVSTQRRRNKLPGIL